MWSNSVVRFLSLLAVVKVTLSPYTGGDGFNEGGIGLTFVAREATYTG